MGVIHRYFKEEIIHFPGGGDHHAMSTGNTFMCNRPSIILWFFSYF